MQSSNNETKLSRADQVSKYVQQLKQKQITRQELFQKLADLRKNDTDNTSTSEHEDKPTTTTAATSVDGKVDNNECEQNATVLSSKRSHEATRQHIQHLIEEKRRARDALRAGATSDKTETSTVTSTQVEPLDGENDESQHMQESSRVPQPQHKEPSLEVNSLTRSITEAVSNVMEQHLSSSITSKHDLDQQSDTGQVKVNDDIGPKAVNETEIEHEPIPEDALSTDEVSWTASVNARSHPNAITAQSTLDRSSSKAGPYTKAALQSTTKIDRRPPAPPASTPTTTRSVSSNVVAPGTVPSAMEARIAARAIQRKTHDSPETYSFKPKVNPLPSQYGSSQAYQAVPFHARVNQWRTQREQEIARRRQEQLSKETAQCTFQPNLIDSSMSSRARSASRSRIDANRLPVHERLYRAATPSAARKRASFCNSMNASAEQPTRQIKSGARSSSVPPSRPNQPPALASWEQSELAECTFKPAVHPQRGSATPVRSRYLSAAAKHSKSAKASRSASQTRDRSSVGDASHARSNNMPTGYEECTFAPRTNPVKAEMGSAVAYVQTDVYQRLSRAATASKPPRSESRTRQPHPASSSEKVVIDSEEEERTAVMDMQTFMAALSGSKHADENDSPKGHNEMKMTEKDISADKAEKRRRFQEFLARQNHYYTKKKQHLEETKNMLTPTYTPSLCRKSIELASSSQKSSFLNRISTTLRRREHETLTKRAVVERDSECTFKPKINPKSKSKPARTVEELSIGDAFKRETKQRLLRLKAEQEELAGLTFRPQRFSNAGEHVQSKLKILSDPNGYVERLQAQAMQAHDRWQTGVAEIEASELAECTFKPEVHEAPTYVKRIAKSMALTRAINARSLEDEKPEWR